MRSKGFKVSDVGGEDEDAVTAGLKISNGDYDGVYGRGSSPACWRHLVPQLAGRVRSRLVERRPTGSSQSAAQLMVARPARPSLGEHGRRAHQLIAGPEGRE